MHIGVKTYSVHDDNVFGKLLEYAQGVAMFINTVPEISIREHMEKDLFIFVNQLQEDIIVARKRSEQILPSKAPAQLPNSESQSSDLPEQRGPADWVSSSSSIELSDHALGSTVTVPATPDYELYEDTYDMAPTHSAYRSEPSDSFPRKKFYLAEESVYPPPEPSETSFINNNAKNYNSQHVNPDEKIGSHSRQSQFRNYQESSNILPFYSRKTTNPKNIASPTDFNRGKSSSYGLTPNERDGQKGVLHKNKFNMLSNTMLKNHENHVHISKQPTESSSLENLQGDNEPTKLSSFPHQLQKEMGFIEDQESDVFFKTSNENFELHVPETMNAPENPVEQPTEPVSANYTHFFVLPTVHHGILHIDGKDIPKDSQEAVIAVEKFITDTLERIRYVKDNVRRKTLTSKFIEQMQTFGNKYYNVHSTNDR